MSAQPGKRAGTRGFRYEIIVEGRLDGSWSDWFDGLTVENLPDGRAMLCGPLPDQAALHGVVLRIFNLNLTLVSIRKIEE